MATKRITSDNITGQATGRDRDRDPLGGAAGKDDPTEDDVRRLRYDAKHNDDGTALSPERNEMYDDLTGVGESGSQGDRTGREDQNAIGPNGQP